MFDLDKFIEDCLSLSRGEHAPKRVLERMREALADPEAIKRSVPPLDEKVGVLDAPLYRSSELTVLNVTLRPGVLSIPHDHRMWAVIGIYGGEEANTFFRRNGRGLEESNHRTCVAGDAILLGADVVHAIENPLAEPTLGLHVYGGDLLSAPRNMWDPHTGEERPYEVQQFYRWSRDRALLRRTEKSPAAGG